MVNKQTLDVKIIDLDLAQKIGGKNAGVSRQFYGSPDYLSPEILKQKPYLIEKNDVWQLGVVLYILLFSERPFESYNDILTYDITPKIISLSEKASYFQSEKKIDLLASMLSKDPELRPTLDEILTSFD